MAILGYSNLFWTNLTPGKGYVGIVTNKEKIVVQTIDSSNQYFMNASSLWRDEKVTWYDIADTDSEESERYPPQAFNGYWNFADK